MIKPLRLGPINSIQDAAKAFHDLEQFLSQVYQQAAFTEDADPGAGAISFWVREDDGSDHLWTLVGGAGMTLTGNPATRILTLTSP